VLCVNIIEYTHLLCEIFLKIFLYSACRPILHVWGTCIFHLCVNYMHEGYDGCTTQGLTKSNDTHNYNTSDLYSTHSIPRGRTTQPPIVKKTQLLFKAFIDIKAPDTHSKPWFRLLTKGHFQAQFTYLGRRHENLYR